MVMMMMTMMMMMMAMVMMMMMATVVTKPGYPEFLFCSGTSNRFDKQ